MNPFTRYRPIGAQPTGIFPPVDDSMPGANLPAAFDSTSYAQDGNGSLSEDPQYSGPEDLAFSDANSARPIQAPPVAPSMDVRSMDPTKSLRPIAAQSQNNDDNPQAMPPMPPPGIQGAPLPPTPAEASLARFDATGKPQTPEDAALAKYVALHRPDRNDLNPDGTPRYKGGKLRTILGAIAGGLEGAAAGYNHNPNAGAMGQAVRQNVQYPGLARDTAKFENQQADLAGQIKLADQVEDIRSKIAMRGDIPAQRAAAAQDREQKELDAAATHGLQIIPPGQTLPPGTVPMPLSPALAANPQYKGYQLARDPHFGQFQVTAGQDASGTLPVGSWQNVSLLPTLITASNKPDAATTKISATQAKAWGIMNAPGADGLVELPSKDATALLTEQMRSTAKPKKEPLSGADRAYMKQAGGDPDNEASWTPDILKRFENVKKERPVVVNNNAETTALDRESGRFAKPHEKAFTDANSQIDKIDEAQMMVRGGAVDQALGVPKVMTALISGAGSGVRITQAELSAIANARGIGGDIEGTLRSWMGKGKLTPDQQHALNGILEDVKQRVLVKRDIADEALAGINSGASRDEIIHADAMARQKLKDMEHPKAATPAAGQLPPQAVAQLREGHDTTFANGQVWRLMNGQPKRMK